MSLIAAGLINIDGDLVDVVRSITCAAEANVGAGATVSDGGESRFIAETHAAAVAGDRIDMGTIPFSSDRSVVVRALFRAGDGGTGNYESLGSRGAVFEPASEFAFGWRGTSLAPFQYRNPASFVPHGSEASGQPSLTPGAAYTILYRANAASQQLYYCAQDIGGAGIDFILVTSSAAALGTDGSQHVFLGGPNTFTSADRSINAGILGALIYNHRLSDTELAAVALDGATGFYAQIPTGGASRVPLIVNQVRAFLRRSS